SLSRTTTIGVESRPSFEQSGGRGTVGEVDFYQVGKRLAPIQLHASCFRVSLTAIAYPTSHEGLMLEYEHALTRTLPLPAAARSKGRTDRQDEAQDLLQDYNTSAHFLWIGDRTRQLTGAHVEYFRGIRNPIGVKVGPSMAADELVRLLDIVNPLKEAGRVTLITRYGAGKIDTHLAGHISAVQKSGHGVVWICDPMHGNMQTSASGLKTRHFGTIISELTACLRIHAACKSRLGVIGLEFTCELNEEGFSSVTKCVGGSMELSKEQLGLRYQTSRSSFQAKKERRGVKPAEGDVCTRH
ncbi:class-II DAHP synthetase family-domain-containing protein, partial [Mycena leptocephala]